MNVASKFENANNTSLMETERVSQYVYVSVSVLTGCS
jgi:hypothetical protein